MSAVRLHNTLKQRREQLGLSQQALARRVGVSRQAIIAIEAGRQVPATSLSLVLARTLGCTVDELFSLQDATELEARLAPAPITPGSARALSARVALGRVHDRWVAHQLDAIGERAADGIMTQGSDADTQVLVRPLTPAAQLERHVLIAGCAPLLATLPHRVSTRCSDARVTWLPCSSKRALDLLEAKLIHVAGIHLADPNAGEEHASLVRRRFPGQSMLLVHLTRWRQGLLVAPGNPKALHSAADLLRPDLNVVTRQAGAGTTKLLKRLLKGETLQPSSQAAIAQGHTDVAQRVRWGAADVGVAIEAVAIQAGLDFIPLVEESFDLVLPTEFASQAPVARLLDSLDDPNFRVDLTHLPGYDGSQCGHVTTLEAA